MHKVFPWCLATPPSNASDLTKSFISYHILSKLLYRPFPRNLFRVRLISAAHPWWKRDLWRKTAFTEVSARYGWLGFFAPARYKARQLLLGLDVQREP